MARARLYMREDRAILIAASRLASLVGPAGAPAPGLWGKALATFEREAYSLSPGRGRLLSRAELTRPSRSLSVVPLGSIPSRRFSLFMSVGSMAQNRSCTLVEAPVCISPSPNFLRTRPSALSSVSSFIPAGAIVPFEALDDSVPFASVSKIAGNRFCS
eukprot:1305992-Pleurochrysis_carterae.AAC.1